jgi:hypothetical protein
LGKGSLFLQTGSLRLKNKRRANTDCKTCVLEFPLKWGGGVNGIESIVEIQLNEAEKTKLTASAAAAEKTNGLLIHEPPVSTKCKKPLFWVFYAFNSKLLKILPMNFVMFFLTLLKIHVSLSI